MSQVLFVGVAQLLVLLGANGQGAPPGLPPLAEDPVLAAAAPPQCLAYLTWSGAAAPDEKSTNRTEQLLAEPAVQKLIEGVGGMIRNGILSAATKEHPDARPAVEDAITVGTAFFHRPMAAFLSKFEPNLRPAHGQLAAYHGRWPDRQSWR